MVNLIKLKYSHISFFVKLFLNIILKMQINVIYFDENIIEKLTKIAYLNNVTLYDSCYCVIAEEHGCKLITGDEKLKKKMNKPYFISLNDYDFAKI
ncbi:MAG: type II toxin-antitoxin system VapC family toxin [Candidatus Helarchaeota archaeon]